MLQPRQIEDYRANGFVVVEQLLPPATVSALSVTIACMVDNARSVSEHNHLYDLGPGHTFAAPHVRRIKEPHKIHPIFLHTLVNSGILAIVQQLIGPDLRIKSSKINLKLAGGLETIEWHQDWAWYPQTNDDMLAVGILLDECTKENGPLLVLPGSHTGPIFDHHVDGYFAGAIDHIRSGLDFSQAVPCLGPAGSVSIHHARLVHGSAANLSKNHRRMIFYEISAADAWPLLGVTDLEAFEGSIISGRVLRPRLAEIPVRLPLPRAIYQGSIFENQRPLTNRYFV